MPADGTSNVAISLSCQMNTFRCEAAPTAPLAMDATFEMQIAATGASSVEDMDNNEWPGTSAAAGVVGEVTGHRALRSL